MKKRLIQTLCLYLLFILNSQADDQVRTRELFNDSWKFQYFGILDESAVDKLSHDLPKETFNDSSWRELSLPHDWAIEGPFQKSLPNRTGKLPWQGVGVYRKTFKVSGPSVLDRFFIDFDGAMSHAKVWLNGKYLGMWPNGYNSFRIELTKAIHLDKQNHLCVILNNPINSSRWYPGAGIYRNVWLVKTGDFAVSHNGIFVQSKVLDQRSAEIKIQVELENRTQAKKTFSLVHKLFDASALVLEKKSSVFELESGMKSEFNEQLILQNPKLWGIEKPHLYKLKTYVYEGEKLVDQVENTFGIRSINFDANKGFFLNGKKIKLKGVCLHHDLGPLGTAVDTEAIARRLDLLKEMGCNAIRTAHNPFCPDFMDLCDQKGFLVVNELFDGWASPKTENDYAKHFFEWYKKDVANFVRRDRNHPSVIMWSSGNEVRDGYFGKEKLFEHSRMLSKEFKLHDSTRPVTVGCDNIWFGFGGFQKTVDLFGFNYKPHKYQEFHEKNPAIPIMGSETASTVSSRGEYVFPVVGDKNQGYDPKTFHMSSYDLYAPEWASAPDVEFAAQDKYDFVLGEFVWTGFDYFGEPTPFNNDPSILSNLKDPKQIKKLEEKMKRMGGAAPSKSSYFGIMDLCGFKKDRFYLYQAKWRPGLPMAHILPHWNWSERSGQITPVHVYSSGDEAELFLNGKSLGVRKKAKYEYRFRWDDVIYESGQLKVIVKKKGALWTEAFMKTSGAAEVLHLEAEEKSNDTSPLIFIKVKLLDAKGSLVPRDDREVEFSVEGDAEIVAVGNGDPTSHEPNKSNKRKLFNGLCQVIMKRTGSGLIRLTAKSKGMKSSSIELKSH